MKRKVQIRESRIITIEVEAQSHDEAIHHAEDTYWCSEESELRDDPSVHLASVQIDAITVLEPETEGA